MKEVPALFVEILILFKAIERDKVTVKISKFRANFHRALKCEVPDETYFTNLAQTVHIVYMLPNRNDHISSFCAANVHGIQVFLFLDEAGGGDLWLEQAFVSILTIFCHKHKHMCENADFFTSQLYSILFAR